MPLLLNEYICPLYGSYKKHVIKDPREMPCGVNVCARCIRRCVKETRALSDKAACQIVGCEFKEHSLDQLSAVLNASASNDFISSNIQSIAVDVVAKYNIIDEKLRIPKDQARKILLWIETAENEIETRVESVRILIDQLSEQLLVKVDKCQNALSLDSLAQRLLKTRNKKKSLKSINKSEKLSKFISLHSEFKLTPYRQSISKENLGSFYEYKPVFVDILKAVENDHAEDTLHFLITKEDSMQLVATKNLLHVAIRKRYSNIAEILIKNGASLDARDNIGWTPLMNAAWVGDALITEMLLEHHANKDEMNDIGNTALILGIHSRVPHHFKTSYKLLFIQAIRKRFNDVIKLLTENKA